MGKNLILLGTDRNNMVEARNPIENYPLPWEMSKLFRNAKAVWTSLDYDSPKPEDIAVSFATAGMGFNESKSRYGKMNQRRFAECSNFSYQQIDNTNDYCFHRNCLQKTYNE